MSSERPPSASSSSTTLDDALALAERCASALERVDGVVAIALGGSWARGAGRPNSDVDLGLYYDASAAPDLEALRSTAAGLDDRGSGDAVTDYGEWGPWMNGGAWLLVDGIRVDWIYRESGLVRDTIAACVGGDVRCDFYAGYPHGFHNHSYAAETALCRPLRDPHGTLERLRQAVAIYPEALRDAIVQRYTFDADFMLYNGRSSAARGDVFHASGCLYRCAAALVQVLFAVNERWYVNEKGALAATDSFTCIPTDFAARATALLAKPGADVNELEHSIEQMSELIDDVRDLVG